MEVLLALTLLPAWAVGMFFLRYDPGPPEPKSELRNAFLFGLLSIVLALLFSAALSFVFDQAGVIEQNPNRMFDFILAIFGYASIEEVVKFIPLALYVYHRPFFNENTDGIIYFSFVGLTFGGIESLLYALTSGSAGIFVAIFRLVLGFFFHAALTSFVGYFLAHAKVSKQGMYKVLLALIFACLMHTLYNYGAYMVTRNTSAIFISAAVGLMMNAIMFWFYYLAGEEDKRLGLAGPQFRSLGQYPQPYAPAQQGGSYAPQQQAQQPMQQPQGPSPNNTVQ